MPVKAVDTEIAYTGDGISTAFPFPFEVAVSGDFAATIDGVVTTAYSLSGLGVDTGGTCTFTTPPGADTSVVLYRNAAYERQLIDYQYGGEFAADTVDSDFDRVVMLVQQLATLAKRMPRTPRGNLGYNLDLVPEAGKLLGWSSDLTSLVNVDVATVTPVGLTFTLVGELLVTAATQAAARAVIDALGPDDLQAEIARLEYGWRNRLSNGSFRVHQLVDAITVGTGSLLVCADTWQGRSGSAPSGTLAIVRTASTTPGEPRYCLRMARTSGTYAGTLVAETIIETADCWDLANQTVTLQAKIRKGAGSQITSARISIITGTGTDQGWASLAAGTWTGIATQPISTIALASITTAYQTLSGQFTIPAGTKEIGVRLEALGFTGTGAGTDYIEWAEVQLEIGDIQPSQFEHLPYGVDLARCQRWIEKSFNDGDRPSAPSTQGAPQHRSQDVGTVLDTLRAPYKVQKVRSVAPTFYSTVTGAANTVRDTTAAADAAVTAGSTQNYGDSSTGMPTLSAAGVAGHIYEAHWIANCML